jgi:hypothetical protein
MLGRLCLAVLFLFALSAAALADDWMAVKLRGEVLQLVGGQWEPLKRGDVVSDDRVVRTLKTGRVEFRRDAEVISLGPDTQIQIHDRSGQRFTTVTQHFGQVTIEAEVRNVQHFAVETANLAAVVKGTRFVVTAGKDWSKVDVQRGHVAVESELTHSTTVIAKGQSATASATAELQVEGRGNLPPVVGANGRIVSGEVAPLSPKDAADLAKKLAQAAKKAAGEEKKALEKAAREAEKAAKAAEKAAEKGQKDEKGSNKAGTDAGKPADRPEKPEKADKKSEKKDK